MTVPTTVPPAAPDKPASFAPEPPRTQTALHRVLSERPNPTGMSGTLADIFRDPQVAALARKVGLRKMDLRAVERQVEPLDPDELAVLGCLPQPAMLWPVLPRAGIALVHGPRGIGLTQVVVGMAVAVATGTAVLDWQAEKPASVLLLSGTMSAHALAGRVEAARCALPEGTEIGDRLDVAAMGRKARMLPDLATDAGCHELAVLAARAEVVVIDDLAGLLPGGRLGAPAAARLQQLLAGFRRDGKTVVVAQAKGRRNEPGHDLVQRLADVEIRLAWPAGYRPTEGCRFELHIERARHLDGAYRLPREVRLAEDEDGRQAWLSAPIGASRRAIFGPLVRQGVDVRAAGREAGISQATAYRWAKEMRDVAAAQATRENDENENRTEPGENENAVAYDDRGVPWTVMSTDVEDETAAFDPDDVQSGENENPAESAPSLVNVVDANGKAEAAAASDESAQGGENENPPAAPPAERKLNRRMRRRIAKLERSARIHHRSRQWTGTPARAAA
jgi:hypothetical protein